MLGKFQTENPCDHKELEEKMELFIKKACIAMTESIKFINTLMEL